MNQDNIYDVIIIGAGPAGLTSGIYTAREDISTLIIEKGMCGGQTTISDHIENFPGVPDGINGMEFAQKLKAQAQKFGAGIHELEEVSNIKIENDLIVVRTPKAAYKSKSVIITAGAVFRTLNIPGEKEFIGKGVSYCATCDGPLFKNKEVAVIGGGNTALEEALFLAKFAKKVIIVHRRFEFRGSAVLVERLKKLNNVEFLLNYIPLEIKGETLINSIILQEKDNKQDKLLKLDGIFIAVGYASEASFIKDLVDLDDAGFIKTDQDMKTKTKGVFAAGDVRSKPIRQIILACADGTIAALSVRDYLK